ncbi:MAG: sulfite exporter TauE/SafE family protein [Betaproteobacteria bacterium]|nr:sulfite exporter TauE/SafE family protein [Betaproteobacteria bacterium]NBY06070.1 sulfite exporter TauE/SafE family protein [Betaproteobacteria bacterium]
MDVLLVSLASALAGFIDAMVGGGGLVLVPALFATYPLAHPATLLGNNKSASVWGTTWSCWQYSRRIELHWTSLWPGAVAAWVGAWLGAYAVTQLDPAFLRRALPVVLLLILAYTLARKDMGRSQMPRWAGRAEALAFAWLGLGLGFYDGFFGPGTGSFWVFALVRVLGYDFLTASAHAKVLNTASNLAALVLLSLKGHVWWHMAFYLAAANVLGSWLGTRMALRHGAGFVRWVFVLVVSALIVKTGWDAFIR